jgi:hypothetical protein
MGKEKETFEEYIRGIIMKKVFSDWWKTVKYFPCLRVMCHVCWHTYFLEGTKLTC